MRRLKGLWRIDLIRQSLTAFAIAGGVMAIVVGAAFALDSGSPHYVNVTGFESSETVDARNRGAATYEGSRQGILLGRREAERAIDALLAEGTQAEGYELAYRYGWNLLIWESSRVATLQLNAGAEGTQWIELLR